MERKIIIAEQISKLTHDDIQEVMHGNANSEFRLHTLMRIAELESMLKAVESQRLAFMKESVNEVNNRKASSQSWYKNALIGSWCL